MIEAKRQALGRRTDRLSPVTISREVVRKRDKIQDLARRMNEAQMRRVGTLGERLAGLERMRETLGYHATLERGYAVVRGDGALVTDTKAARKARDIEIEFADGKVTLGGKTAPKKPTKPPEQGSLF
jgi:exodeoxyribonuclease VII large subunit